MVDQDPDQIVVAANGDVYVAAVGTTAPTDITDAISSEWTKLGLITEDGVTFKDGKTIEPIKSWQLFYPGRRIVTEKEATISFVLQQWAEATVVLAFGGGTVSSPVAGAYRYTPPTDPSVRDERACLIAWVDGTKSYRLIVPRVEVVEDVETNLVRTSEAGLPIGLAVNGDEGVAPWYLDTDDPALAPTGS